MRNATAFLGALLGVLGCQPMRHLDGTLGERGRVAFAYQRNCFFGCPIAQPLLSGTRQSVTLTGPGDDAHIRVASSDPEVADFALERQCYCERNGADTRVEVADDASCRVGYVKRCDNTVLVEAGVEGEAWLELHESGSALIDRVALEVRDADRARFSLTAPDALGPLQTKRFELQVGDMADVELTLYDAEGRELLAPEGVHYAIDDPAVATVSAWLLGGGAAVDAGLDVSLQALAAGDTALRVTVPGLEAVATVHVVEP